MSLSSSVPTASVPPSLNITAGKSVGTFAITAQAVSSQVVSTITATMGTNFQTAPLTIVPVGLSAITITPSSVAGGSPASGTIILNGIAPKGGFIVKLRSSLTNVVVPASVNIPVGSRTYPFKISTTTTAKALTATVAATLAQVTVSTSLTVNPPVLQSISLAPTSVAGGASSTGTVALSGPAPTGGMVVTLSSDSIFAVLPKSVTIPAGKAAVTFVVKTTAVAKQAVANILGSLSGQQVQASLTITAPQLASLTLNPTSIVGGKSSTGTIKISSAAPAGGLVISISSSQAAAIPPATLLIPAGALSATFTVKTLKVQSKTTAVIQASLGTAIKAANLTIS